MSRSLAWPAGMVIALCACWLTSCSHLNDASSTDTMYVASQGSNQIWGYRANFLNGSLTNINGSPFAASAAQPTAIIIDPAHNFAYLNGLESGSYVIQRFSIDSNGSLAPVGGNPVVVGLTQVAMAMDSGGRFLFVVSQQDTSSPQSPRPGMIQVFAIGSNASLSLVASQKLAAPSSLAVPSGVALAVLPLNNIFYLYIADQVDGLVLIYTFDPSAGTLSSSVTLPAVAVGTSPSAMAIATVPASGSIQGPSFLYVANQGSNNLHAFRVDLSPGNLGNLLAISGSPYAVGLSPVSVAVDPSVQYLYVADQASNQITGFRINHTTGGLTYLGNSPFNTGVGPSFVAISPTNRYLYVSNYTAGTVNSALIDPQTGNLGPGTPVTVGLQPVGIAFGR